MSCLYEIMPECPVLGTGMNGIRLAGVLGGGQPPKVDESSAEMLRPLGGELHFL